MRVAIVAPLVTPIREPQLGGSQALLADIASGLAARGHEVDVYAASGSGIEGVRVVDAGVRSEVLAATLFRAGSVRHRVSPEATAAFSRVYSIVHAHDHEVVHNHAFDVPAIELAPRDMPVVHTLHLPSDPHIARALDDARSRTESFAAVAVSKRSARDWSTLTTIDEVVRDGVPVGHIPWSPDPGEFALYAGRFSPEKGTLEAIEIAKRASVPMVVVGSPYDREYACRVRAAADEAGAEVKDAMPRTDLWELMASARVVLCPAVWDEPFGLVAAEAQAAGCPVVAFRRGALDEVIADGETGSLVDDVPEAVEAMREVSGFDRSACRRHAERSLSIEATIDGYEALYERLISSARAGS